MEKLIFEHLKNELLSEYGYLKQKFIEDESFDEYLRNFVTLLLHTNIKSYESFSQNELYVLRAHFGIITGSFETYRDIANELGDSIESILDYRESAFKNIRNSLLRGNKLNMLYLENIYARQISEKELSQVTDYERLIASQSEETRKSSIPVEDGFEYYSQLHEQLTKEFYAQFSIETEQGPVRTRK